MGDDGLAFPGVRVEFLSVSVEGSELINILSYSQWTGDLFPTILCIREI